MKKDKVLDILDNVFWYIIYMLPVVAYLISICGNGDSSITIVQYFDQFFALSDDNMILSSLQSIFGSDGVFQIFDNSSYVFRLLTYFVSCFIFHIAIDFLLFIPRLCHKWMSCFNNVLGGSRK